MRTRGKSTAKSKNLDADPEKNDTIDNQPSKKASHRKLKKSADDATHGSQRGQKKLTSYFGMTGNNFEETATEPEEVNDRSLKAELKQQQEQIEKLKLQKQVIENRYSKLYLQSKSYKAKAKETLARVLREKAAIVRKQRGKIDERLGHFATRREFHQGSFYTQIYEEIAEKQEELNRVESELKKAKSDENKQNLKFSHKFIKKSIKELYEKIAKKESELNAYKERLKLHMNEKKCTYQQENWPILKDSNGMERYQTLQLLGKGGFGEVYKCFDVESNEYVAIKKVNLSSIDFNVRQETLKHVSRQIKTQQSLKHSKIVQIKDILQINLNNIEFVMEHCQGKDLGVQLRQQKCFQEKQARHLIYQIFEGLAYLTSLSPKVIHYDLKPSNIIYHYGNAKILDFGLCKLMDTEKSRMELTSQGVGTYWYLPPEAFMELDPEITAKVDVWSAGVIFYELLYGSRPFADGIPQKTIYHENLICKQGKKVNFPQTTPKMYRVSDQAKQFIKECLQYDPEKRISAQKAVQHPYFKN